MKKNNYKNILGIETSCDDTAIGIVTSEKSILSNIVINQNSNLNKYGGIVPEIAARDHLSNIDYAIQAALDKAKLELNDIDLITATGGPGLIGGVIVGTVFAKSLAMSLDRPYVAVNHLEGHALTARLTDNVKYPYLLLLVSGGHTMLLAFMMGRWRVFGETLDITLGQLLDQFGRSLGFASPCGKQIENVAKKTTNYIPLPYSVKGNDVSFSVLLSSAKSIVKKGKEEESCF